MRNLNGQLMWVWPAGWEGEVQSARVSTEPQREG